MILRERVTFNKMRLKLTGYFVFIQLVHKEHFVMITDTDDKMIRSEKVWCQMKTYIILYMKHFSLKWIFDLDFAS